jgi:UTP:GlnB (protein PII) uridylyltransferase
MKKFFAICLFVTVGVCLQAQTLSWDIQFLRGSERESVPISRAIRMETGNLAQIIITPTLDCFCYVVLYDSAREISVLHNQPVTGNNSINLGPFTIEEPSGAETLYVIMTLNRQTTLESLIQTHSSNPGLRQNTDNLRNEVVRLQNEASGLGEPASVFIASGGTTRTAGVSPETYVTRFSERNMYVRTITIRH